MKLDGRDRQLLKLLQNDCRISNIELAERAGMSASACWRRVRAFEEVGIIERYGAMLRPGKVGLSFQAIVHVQLSRHEPEAIEGFIRAVSARNEVRECYATTGQADYHLVVLCRDLDAYNHFLDDFLFGLPAVRGAQTNLVLKEIKRSAVLDI